ncbi:hypothetical protein FIBSPDRAFT_886209 [Athelia psychrophila]|uniref:Uncharacterized protein n=1 Tax=Athelia psychrophila TaxID=1759441 RepID=A0A166R7M9_9AGAM|nr:hypothetical protein FIBSPDRAFT_886209 [Fibularhizoctonia sp. CBS 109695]
MPTLQPMFFYSFAETRAQKMIISTFNQTVLFRSGCDSRLTIGVYTSAGEAFGNISYTQWPNLRPTTGLLSVFLVSNLNLIACHAGRHFLNQTIGGGPVDRKTSYLYPSEKEQLHYRRTLSSPDRDTIEHKVLPLPNSADPRDKWGFPTYAEYQIVGSRYHSLISVTKQFKALIS